MAFTIFACWVASGIVFGFAALKPVLVEEGVYHDNCSESELREGIELCTKQDLGLNFFFTVASITANVSALPVGTILDRYGSRLCGLIGCFLLAIGSVLMILSFHQPGFQGFIAGNFFLALAGTFIFVPSFQIANAFPRHAGKIVALVTGAFDASAAVFLFYRYAYEGSGRTFTPDKFFMGYLAVPVIILLALVTFMPKRDYQTTFQLESKIEQAEDATRDVHSSDDEIENARELIRVRSKRANLRKEQIHQINEVLGGADVRQQRAEREEDRQQKSQVWGVLHGLPAHKQMATPWFILNHSHDCASDGAYELFHRHHPVAIRVHAWLRGTGRQNQRVFRCRSACGRCSVHPVHRLSPRSTERAGHAGSNCRFYHDNRHPQLYSCTVGRVHDSDSVCAAATALLFRNEVPPTPTILNINPRHS